jgi:uncharacterized protein (TIGR00251 family)
MSELTIQDESGGVRFEVRVSPRASRDAILGVHDGALKVALTAPPVEGAANAALIAFLAKALGVTKRAVTITSGEASRQKRVQIAGVTGADVRRLIV